MENQTVFISYSQKDKERVSLFASIMAQNGFDVWMDVKCISLGQSIISAIEDGLSAADIYMLFISHNSMQSSWVNEELKMAFTLNLKSGKPRIIPVLLDDCSIPPILSDRLYLDARKSIQTALSQLNAELQKQGQNLSTIIIPPQVPILTGVVFGLSKETNISIGPFCNDFSKEDLINDRATVQKLLRKRANGILMNFVPLSDFDLQSPVPKYKNGVYDETIERVSGGTESSICERIIARATVFNPDSKKLNELVKNKLDKLYATSLTYIFSIPFQKDSFDKKCMKKIQDNYSIISYDFEDGATIEYDSNFFVSIKCSLEQVQIKLQTEYAFLFSKNATKFSPFDFIEWLLNEI